MRSRTEMVTTTFVDSEEDYSDDDDSEEDWRPSASNKNGKKLKQQKSGSGTSAKRGRKRKNSSTSGSKNFKRKNANEDSEDEDDDENDDLNEPSEDDLEYDGYEETQSKPSKNKPTILPPKKQFLDTNSSDSSYDNEPEDVFHLLVYVKDLTGSDLNKNNRLCLWRKDNNNLLQKYIRVKTSPEEFIFTSSSVYSSFDDKRVSDFHEIEVKPIDSTNRRVKIINPSKLQTLSLEAAKTANSSDDDNYSDEKSDSVEVTKQNSEKAKVNRKKPIPKCNDDDGDNDDDEEEEVEGENDEGENEGDDDAEEIEENDETDN